LPKPVTAAGLAAGLTAAQWPSIPLSHDDLIKLLPAALADTECFNAETTLTKHCDFGATDGTQTAVLLGDSVAMTYEPTINAALPSWKIVTFGKASCPWADVLVSTESSSSYSSCLDFHKTVFQQIVDLHPAAIFLSNSENSIATLASHAQGADAQQEWGKGEQATLRALTAAHVPIYVLLPPPVGTNVATCATRFNGPQNCNLKCPTTSWQAEQSATSEAVAGMTDVTVIDPTSWVCVQDQSPAVYDNEPIRTDGQHLTQAFATNLAANFLTAVRKTDPKLFASR
jgi:hypothetical protein